MPAPGFRHVVIAALPGALSELIEKSGLTKSSVIRWLRIMRDENVCHVSGWKRTGGNGPIKRVYSYGPGPDAPCNLKPMGGACYSARSRKKHPENCEIYNARRRARTTADRVAKTPNTWLNILGGAA
jgi:hypothetical protein